MVYLEKRKFENIVFYNLRLRVPRKHRVFSLICATNAIYLRKTKASENIVFYNLRLRVPHKNERFFVKNQVSN